MAERLSVAEMRRSTPLPDAYDVRILETVDSTNRYLRRLAAEGRPAGTVVFAEAQTEGRGRLGRPFFSPAGAGLYMSLLLRPRARTLDAFPLTAFAAVAVAEAIEAETPLRPQIKWVNDIYLDGKKVCGILAEGILAPDADRFDAVILGIGLNVGAAPLPKELLGVATSLEDEIGAPVSRNRLAAALLSSLSPLLSGEIPPNFIDAYRRRDLLSGREVTVHAGDVSYTARAEGIDDDGALRVCLPSGERRRLSFGEVSVRL